MVYRDFAGIVAGTTIVRVCLALERARVHARVVLFRCTLAFKQHLGGDDGPRRARAARASGATSGGASGRLPSDGLVLSRPSNVGP